VIEIQLLPDGSVLSSKVVRSSGSFAFDRASEAAVSRASPLPIPEDKDLVSDFRHFNFTFDPSIA
jgi:colicin import membrane protein